MGHSTKYTSTDDLHGYQPVYVDESCLTFAQRLESYEDRVRARVAHEEFVDWQDYLTAEEKVFMAKKPRILRHTKSGPVYDSEEARSLGAEQAEVLKLCWHRRTACLMYNGGRRHWYGDGVPPWVTTE